MAPRLLSRHTRNRCQGREDSLLHVGVCRTLLSSQVLLKGVQRDRKHLTTYCQPGCSPRAGVYVPPSLQCRSPTQSACYLIVLQNRCSKQRVSGDVNSAPSALQSQLKGISGGYIVAMGHAVAQLLEALRYMPEGCGFDSRWCHWNFSLT